MAASLHKFAMSAPENPGVSHASRRAMSNDAPPSVIVFKWTSKISFRPCRSGRPTKTCLSKRPGRVRASSRISALLVPARTTTPEDGLKPSISTKSWFKVFSRSSLPPAKALFPRLRPMASISSINIMQGAAARASLNRSRTREGPTPTNISTKSEPETE